MKKLKNKIIGMGEFEPPSPAPKAGMIDHYTTSLFIYLITSHLYARGATLAFIYQILDAVYICRFFVKPVYHYRLTRLLSSTK